MEKKVEFVKPPVIELVIGIQFDSPLLKNSFMYEFYHKNKTYYPNIQEQPTLPSVIENVEEERLTRILQGFHSRKFFINSLGDKLIQMQSDKILFNWRKMSESSEYPKFASVLYNFNVILEQILKENPVLNEKINQLEVTFVDHIFIKDFKLELYNLNKIFTHFSLPDDIKMINCTIDIPKKEINGNLILVIKSAKSNKDHSKLIVCETTCRGMKEKNESINEWYERAHLLLVEFFLDLFNNNSKKIWGIK